MNITCNSLHLLKLRDEHVFTLLVRHGLLGVATEFGSERPWWHEPHALRPQANPFFPWRVAVCLWQYRPAPSEHALKHSCPFDHLREPW